MATPDKVKYTLEVVFQLTQPDGRSVTIWNNENRAITFTIAPEARAIFNFFGPNNQAGFTTHQIAPGRSFTFGVGMTQASFPPGTDRHEITIDFQFGRQRRATRRQPPAPAFRGTIVAYFEAEN